MQVEGGSGGVVPYSHSGTHVLEALLLSTCGFSVGQQELWQMRKPEGWSRDYKPAVEGSVSPSLPSTFHCSELSLRFRAAGKCYL